jgi:hypothetical protein
VDPIGEDPTEAIAQRIDAIIQALQELRQVVLAPQQSRSGSLASQLYGVLGQGTWDEYDSDLDWHRFAPGS